MTSCLLFVLPPGLGGILLFAKVFGLTTGRSLEEPISLPSVLPFATGMLAALIVGMAVGSIFWTIAISYYLSVEEMRRWGTYPAPRIPVLTRISVALWNRVLEWKIHRESRYP